MSAWSNGSHPLQDFPEAGVGRFLLSFKDRRVYTASGCSWGQRVADGGCQDSHSLQGQRLDFSLPREQRREAPAPPEN